MEKRKEYNRLINLIIMFVIISVITLIIKYYFKPFISMVVIFIITKPLYDFMNKFNIPKKISAAISIFTVNIILILLILYLGGTTVSFVNKFYNENIAKIEEIIKSFGVILDNGMDISKKIISFLNKDFIRVGAVSTTEGIISYFLGNICTFFLMIDKEKFLELLYKLLPKNMIKRVKYQKRNLQQMLIIQIILILISTFEIMIGFIIFRVKKPVFLGILCGILDVLPYVGTIIVFIPIIIYNIIVKYYLKAIGLILLYILVQVSREILETKFLSDKLELHPLLVLLSVYIGVKLFGVLGIVVGPMYGILAKEIIYDEVI
ncbi:AI-2E family transporter [uncultured Clostridium sp.]|uniref:AI-2E family transporter n=1 Tax=uncultured Clostridium sp. TaxID=59620 RepID=UPI0025FA82DC|nr:AI-2E family transporter [uncultured Clostridium sp.]